MSKITIWLLIVCVCFTYITVLSGCVSTSDVNSLSDQTKVTEESSILNTTGLDYDASMFESDSPLNADESNEEHMDKCYKIEDFESIIIGESTFDDVCKIADSETMLLSGGKGLIMALPKQDGRFILITFSMPDLVVMDIEQDAQI